MRSLRRLVESKGPKVPAYIVTYSDMVTLLLTFFVMLLSLAQAQDPGLFNKGRDSFLRSIRYIGLGMLFGRQEMPSLGNLKTKHFVSNPDKSLKLRSIDTKGEETRRVLARLGRAMTIVDSQMAGRKTGFSVADVRFDAGRTSLNEPAKRFLAEFCLNLQDERQYGAFGPVSLYVLGLACEQASQREQWILSARRAQTVAEFMRDSLRSGTGPVGWSVYSWGAGSGSDWAGRGSSGPGQQHILIAVLRQSD